MRAQHLPPVQHMMRSIPRKRWFFCRAGVIPMAVFAIPAGTYDIATHSWLGGQHGEETKEGSEGSEEGRQAAPQEEVGACRSSVFDFERRR
jgi:hypothetical protein